MANNKLQSKLIWAVLIAAGTLFVGSILWSLWFDTLLPLWQAGDTRAVAFHAVGVPVIFIGLGVFVHGGWVFVRDTLRSFGDEEFAARVEAVQEAGLGTDLARARWRNFKHLLRAWWPGALRMAFGFALIALGGYLINL